MSEIPVYKFALREDLKDDKRFLPTRSEPKATGWDVRAAQYDHRDLMISPLQKVLIPLGIRGFCPDGWWYKLVPRSSTFGKKDLHCLYGTIDETFEGELLFACRYIPDFIYSAGDKLIFNMETLDAEPVLRIQFGDKIGQIIPVKREEMKVLELSNEEIDAEFARRNATRGVGGFGSTGS